MRPFGFLLISLVVLILATAGAGATSDPRFRRSNHTCQPLTVREAPSLSAQASFDLPDRTSVKTGTETLVGATTWVSIRTKDKRTGWLDGNYLCDGDHGIPSFVSADTAGAVEYSRLISVPSASADALVRRGRLWVAVAYRSAPSVLMLDDPTGGNLVAKGTMVVAYPVTPWSRKTRGNRTTGEIVVRIDHTLVLECQQERCKVTFKQFAIDGTNDGRRPVRGQSLSEYARDVWDKGTRLSFWSEVDRSVLALIEDLRRVLVERDLADASPWRPSAPFEPPVG